MTHLATDAIWSGGAGTAYDTSGRVPLESVSPSGPAFGAPTINAAPYRIVPATSVNNALAVAATVSGAAFTLAAGTSITSTTITIGARTVTLYALDVPRAVAFSGAATTVTATIYTVSGYDVYLKPMQETISGVSGTSKSSGVKAFAYIEAATATGNTTSSVSFGTLDVFGMPYYTQDLGSTHLTWDSTLVTTSSGLTVAVTGTATATSGDVRGTFAPGTAANGVRALSGIIFIRNPNNEDFVYGVAQYNQY